MEEFESVYLNEVCPLMSEGNKAIRCRKDCAWFNHRAQGCSLKILSEYFLNKLRKHE